MTTSCFKLDTDEQGIATLVMDLPGQKVNILTRTAIEELDSIIRSVEKSSTISMLVIKSGKEGSFIAGADISEIREIVDIDDARNKSLLGQQIMNRISGLPFPTLAVLDGPCLGAGLELALACTYRIASDSKKTSLGLPEVSLGIIPGFGGTQRLPRLVGLVAAIDAIVSGKPLDSRKSLAVHLVDNVYPREFMEEKILEFAKGVLYGDMPHKVCNGRGMKRLSVKFLEGTFPGRMLLFANARKQMLKNTRGNYPAPKAALRVLRKTRSAGLSRGLAVEREEFARLAVTGISKNLIRVYYGNEELRKSTQGDGIPARIRTCSVLGAGVMGGAIAWLASYRDLPVTLVDLRWEYIVKGFQAARKIYGQLMDIRKVDARITDLGMKRISGALDYERLGNTDIVIEAIVEKPDIKRKAFLRLEEHVSRDAIIASNTSSLSISAMQAGMSNPGRFCGMHFFNPVNRMQLVEVIAGDRTSPDTIATVVAFAKELGKTPVVVKDSPGFLVNRILMAYLNEATLMLEDGVDIAALDAALARFGMPMGPFALLDEIGIDIASDVGEIIGNAFRERYLRSEVLGLLKSAKILGKKTGAGFYTYKGRKKAGNEEALDAIRSARKKISTGFDSITAVNRCIYVMINEAALALEEGVAAKPEHVDMAMILGTGFPPFRGGLLRFAEETGIDKVVELLKSLSGKFGKRFEPAKYLVEHRLSFFHGHAA